ncbi:MAG: hypothetical protein KBC21_03985 [Candidatus Pacebacteria bacterium]|nr:hypothetical protein [Candidatus Paceibacterota bacterium]
MTWTEGLLSSVVPDLRPSHSVERLISRVAEVVLTTLRLAHYDNNFTQDEVLQRTWCFVEEMRKDGATFSILRVLQSPTNYVKMEFNNKTYRFEMIPLASAMGDKKRSSLLGNKWKTKEYLMKYSMPTAKGCSFFFLHKKRALLYGEKLGYPLVVKPLNGSVSRHVTTNISNNEELLSAINFACDYSPWFIVERYIKCASLYRATVVDFDHVFITQILPANITGDGENTINSLIIRKNKIRERDTKKERLLHPLIIDNITDTLLKEQGVTMDTVPEKDSRIFLQRDPFPRLGYDLREVTPLAHKDIINLCKKVARLFDVRVVGIDILIPDITISSPEDETVIIEANSAPCIELHHFPSEGEPTSPARALREMFLKYYVK